ncbi:tetratricopeptide repeat protein [Archangium lansingense]|uniref:Tetratricopeptide repeat protein n=1 Tax=Archangium lansingense TaxID=2995310 RepID=A0ABT4A8X6_9BACT|nr:tetratricopeptide repeat protein [Archangium lansinium]MCY1078105.1 tetratricopeptide repeat protein [Archangium lansinium]
MKGWNLVSRYWFGLLGSLVCVLALGCASSPPASPAVPTTKRPSFLSPPEILERMEKSPVSYKVEPQDSPPGGWAEQLWPRQLEPVTWPQVVEEGGSRVLREWPQKPEVQQLLAEAEPHYQAQRFEEAARLYAQATERCPGCYLAWLFRGDAALFGGDPTTALAHYDKAAELNPYDYRAHFYRGSALIRLERSQEAREAWAWSLVLNPRNPIIRQFFQNNRSVGLAITDDVIVPRGRALAQDDGVVIHFDPDHHPAWFAYANCKALWLGEPSHRQEMTGSTEHRFTSAEELECLASAVSLYESGLRKGEEEHEDRALSRLSAIVQGKMATELILFEMAARVHPQITLTLDDEARKRLHAYVLRYVLVPTGGT